MTTLDIKTLQPQLPPGRANRKALAYTHEIQRLRALGYTFDAIRLALLDVGVVVGLTTVKREAAHAAGHAHQPASTPAMQQPVVAQSQLAAAARTSPRPLLSPTSNIHL
jgi:hypothetical protein